MPYSPCIAFVAAAVRARPADDTAMRGLSDIAVYALAAVYLACSQTAIDCYAS